MEYTKEQITEKVLAGDCEWFYDLYINLHSNNKEVKAVYDQHWGDGNDYFITLEFTKLNLFVLLEGTYSSWDSPYWDSVSFAKPYQYVETRYKAIKSSEVK